MVIYLQKLKEFLIQGEALPDIGYRISQQLDCNGICPSLYRIPTNNPFTVQSLSNVRDKLCQREFKSHTKNIFKMTKRLHFQMDFLPFKLCHNRRNHFWKQQLHWIGESNKSICNVKMEELFIQKYIRHTLLGRQGIRYYRWSTFGLKSIDHISSREKKILLSEIGQN